MAFTFSTPAASVGTAGAAYTQDDPVTGLFTLSATTDTSSAAGTFNCPFYPYFRQIFSPCFNHSFNKSIWPAKQKHLRF